MECGGHHKNEQFAVFYFNFINTSWIFFFQKVHLKHFSHDVFSLSSTHNDLAMQVLVWLGMVCFKATRFGGPVQHGYDNASKLQARSMQQEGPATGQLSQVFSGFPRS